MKELTLQQAYELCLKKWEWIKNQGGGLYDICLLNNAIPELEELLYDCAYCKKFFDHDTYKPSKKDCMGCPLNLGRSVSYRTGCSQTNHPYNNWLINPNEKTAQAVIDLIKKTKP